LTDGFHYNGGDIPLRSVLFGERVDDLQPPRGLKWVFTVSAAGYAYYESVRIAVVSALVLLLFISTTSSAAQQYIYANVRIIKWQMRADGFGRWLCLLRVRTHRRGFCAGTVLVVVF